MTVCVPPRWGGIGWKKWSYYAFPTVPKKLSFSVNPRLISIITGLFGPKGTLIMTKRERVKEREIDDSKGGGGKMKGISMNIGVKIRIMNQII